MVDEKDRLGEKLREKEKAEEDRYFKQRDQEALERLRREKAAPGATPAALRCPKDGTGLLSVDHLGIAVEECPTCHGMWLDQGECETLAQRERESWISRFFFRPRL